MEFNNESDSPGNRSTQSRATLALKPATLSLTLMLLAMAFPKNADACEGPMLMGSTVQIQAQASDIDAEGIVGSTRKSSFLGFGKKKTVQDRPSLVQIGLFEMGCNASMWNSQIYINAQGTQIRSRGSTVLIGGVKLP